MALFAKGNCQKLKHKSCGNRLCPCGEARKWLASLPRQMAFDGIWAACDRNDWLLWLAHSFGLKGGHTPDETRQLIPWSKMAETLANPPKELPCDSCDELFPPSELFHGYCEDCEGERVFCSECDDLLDREDNRPCAHLRWCDSVADFVGTGASDSDGLQKSFDDLLIKLGLVLSRKLIVELEKGDFGRRPIGDDFGDCGPRLDELMDHCREHDEVSFEHALLWLDTLHPKQKAYVDMAKLWTKEHVSRREIAIAADKSPRRILVDGGGRFYVKGGTWSAIRAQAFRMTKRKAHRRRRLVEGISPGVNLRVVHVLKSAPAWKGSSDDKKVA